MLVKKAILTALEAKYEAQIAEADATIKIYREFSRYWRTSTTH